MNSGQVLLKDIKAAWAKNQTYMIPSPHANLSVKPKNLGPGILVWSSGSTGEAKAIFLAKDLILAAVKSQNKYLGLSYSDTWLCALPYFHVAGLAILFRCDLAQAALEEAKPRDLAKVLADSKATIVSLVPLQLEELIAQPELLPRLRKFRVILLGGEMPSPSLCELVNTHGLPICYSYGLTESFGLCAGRYATEAHRAMDEYTPLEHISPLISGLDLSLKFKNSEWPPLKTQDEAIWSPETETLKILGRSDRQFKCGGELISPQEIEAAVAKLCGPGIMALAGPLAGVRYPQVPGLVIWSPTRPEVKLWLEALEQKLNHFRSPREVIWIRPSISPEHLGKRTWSQALKLRSQGLSETLWQDHRSQ